MCWGHEGGQAILNFRAWQQSDRFDRAWALIVARYKAELTTIANVIQIKRWPHGTSVLDLHPMQTQRRVWRGGIFYKSTCRFEVGGYIGTAFWLIQSRSTKFEIVPFQWTFLFVRACSYVHPGASALARAAFGRGVVLAGCPKLVRWRWTVARRARRGGDGRMNGVCPRVYGDDSCVVSISQTMTKLLCCSRPGRPSMSKASRRVVVGVGLALALFWLLAKP